MVDALRSLMLTGSKSVFGLGTDFADLINVSGVLVWIAGRRYPSFVM
jgi:hypothetical protein